MFKLRVVGIVVDESCAGCKYADSCSDPCLMLSGDEIICTDFDGPYADEDDIPMIDIVIGAVA